MVTALSIEQELILPIKDTSNYLDIVGGRIPAFDKDAGSGKLFRAIKTIFKDFDRAKRCKRAIKG